MSCDSEHVAEGDCSDLTLEERVNMFGIYLEGEWNDEDLLQILEAVSLIGFKFSIAMGNQGSQHINTFKSVFEGIIFSLDPGLAAKGLYGQSKGNRVSLLPKKVTNRLIAHELGHTFSYRMWNASGGTYADNHPEVFLGYGLYDESGAFMTGDNGTSYSRNNGTQGLSSGYSCSTVPCQYHFYKSDGSLMAGALTASEEWADMFLNWSKGGFTNSSHGVFYANWMTTNMSEWISIASGG